MKAGKRREEENRRLVTDFKEAVCCPSAVVQGAAQQKMKGSAGVTGILEKSNSHFDPAQTGSGTAPPR